MTVRNGTITLPPPATAAGRAGEQRHDPLTHVCATHTDGRNGGIAACAIGQGCESYCGLDLSGAALISVDPAPARPDDCVVCEDLWERRWCPE